MCDGMKKTTAQPHGFIRGAMILTIGVLAVKLMGAVFKIPLTWIIQEDGMGYFTTAYSFYSPVYSLAAAGFPVAISRMVSLHTAEKRYGDVRQVHRVSIPVFLCTGTLGMAAMLAGAWWYTAAVGNPGAIYCMLALAPAVLFSCLSSVYRGYYEGLRNMAPTAISEILEALCRLVLGLSAAWGILDWGLKEYRAHGTVLGNAVDSLAEARAYLLPLSAAGAIVGVTIGAIVSFLFLLLRHRLRGDGISPAMLSRAPKPASGKKTALELIKTALPIGVGAVAVNIAGLVDASFLQARIRHILTVDAGGLLRLYEGMIPSYNLENPETIPNFLFGCYANAHTLFMLIPAVTQAFGVSALPNVTAAWSDGNPKKLRRSIENVIRVTSVFSLPAGIGMAALSEPIVGLLYGDRPSAPIVAGVLPIMAIGAVFASISTPLQSMLQAAGRADIPVKLLAGGLVLKTALGYWLTGMTQWNIAGAAIGTLACYFLMMLGSFIALCRVTGVRPGLGKVFLRPLMAACLCGVSARGIQMFLEPLCPDPRLSALAAIGAAAMVYALSLLGTGAVTGQEIFSLPGVQKIAKILEKRHGIE